MASQITWMVEAVNYGRIEAGCFGWKLICQSNFIGIKMFSKFPFSYCHSVVLRKRCFCHCSDCHPIRCFFTADNFWNVQIFTKPSAKCQVNTARFFFYYLQIIIIPIAAQLVRYTNVLFWRLCWVCEFPFRRFYSFIFRSSPLSSTRASSWCRVT